jgi:hypothetical protein
MDDRKKPNQPGRSGAQARAASGLTRPGDLYLPGDVLPVPDVVEKDTDSVWALWSDVVENDNKPQPSNERDFLETVPLYVDAMEPTQLMGLPELDSDKDTDKKGRPR